MNIVTNPLTLSAAALALVLAAAGEVMIRRRVVRV